MKLICHDKDKAASLGRWWLPTPIHYNLLQIPDGVKRCLTLLFIKFFTYFKWRDINARIRDKDTLNPNRLYDFGYC